MKIAKKVCMILCDDIREEKGEKLSYLGVYGIENSGMILSQIPAVLPKLCLAVLFTETLTQIDKIDVELMSPGAEKIHIVLPGPLPPLSSDNRNVSLGVIISPFKIGAAGEAKFTLRFNDEKKPSIKFPFRILEKK
jgi:hypothetical protein